MKLLLFLTLLLLFSCGKDANINQVLNQIEDSKKSETDLFLADTGEEACEYCLNDEEISSDYIAKDCDEASAQYNECFKQAYLTNKISNTLYVISSSFILPSNGTNWAGQLKLLTQSEYLNNKKDEENNPY